MQQQLEIEFGLKIMSRVEEKRERRIAQFLDIDTRSNQ